MSARREGSPVLFQPAKHSLNAGRGKRNAAIRAPIIHAHRIAIGLGHGSVPVHDEPSRHRRLISGGRNAAAARNCSRASPKRPALPPLLPTETPRSIWPLRFGPLLTDTLTGRLSLGETINWSWYQELFWFMVVSMTVAFVLLVFAREKWPIGATSIASAFIVVGIVFLFIVPWVGIPVGLVGLALAILWLAGFGRRAIDREAPAERNRV